MENKSWKEKLDEVRGFGQPETDSAVTIDEKLTSDEIEEMLKEEFKELSESETPTESLEEKRDSQVHVVMNDGEGLADIFEEKMSSISGVGEIEVISMGLL